MNFTGCLRFLETNRNRYFYHLEQAQEDDEAPLRHSFSLEFSANGEEEVEAENEAEAENEGENMETVEDEKAEDEKMEEPENDPEPSAGNDSLQPLEYLPEAHLDDMNGEGEQGMDFVDSLFAAATNDLTGFTKLEDL